MSRASRFLGPVLSGPVKAMLGPFALPLAIVAAIAGAYGYGVVSTKYRVAAEQERVCNERIASIETRIKDETNRRIEAALRARDETSATPDTPAELLSLCRNDAACRERQK